MYISSPNPNSYIELVLMLSIRHRYHGLNILSQENYLGARGMRCSFPYKSIIVLLSIIILKGKNEINYTRHVTVDWCEQD